MNRLVNFNPKSLLSRFPAGIWLMMALDGCVVISFSLALPFLSLYLHTERELSMTLVGLIFLVGGICSGLTSIAGGMISDRIGRRKTILIISLISIITNLFLGLLVLNHAGIWFIAIIYVVTRSIVGILTPAVYAVVADITPKERLTEAYAVVRIGGNIGFALGPAIGGYLLGLISYGYLFMLAGSVFALMIVLSYFFLKETFLPGPGEKGGFFSAGNFFKDGVFLSFTVLNIMLIISMAHMGSTLSIFSIDKLGFSTLQYGFLLTLNGIIVVLIQYPVAFGVNRLSKRTGLVLGSLFYVIGYSTLAWFNTFNQLLLMILIITIGEVIFSPVSSAVVAELAPGQQRGRYMGLFSLGQTIGFSFAPLFGGVLLDRFSARPPVLWGIIAASGLLTSLGFLVWGRIAMHNKAYAAQSSGRDVDLNTPSQ